MQHNQAAQWLRNAYGNNPDVAEFVARSYRQAFNGEKGDAVLTDLQQACFIRDTTAERGKTGAVDPITMAIAEGRRQVYLHIAGILQLTATDISPPETKPHDHRDERREPGSGISPRYPGGYSPDLDGPRITPASGDATGD